MNKRELLRQIGALAVASPALFTRPAFADPSRDEILATVHPELREIVRQNFAQWVGQPVTRTTLAAHRASSSVYNAIPGVPVEKRIVPGHRGQPDVTVYLINARAGALRPAILHTHGGGYVSGSAASSVASLQLLCKELDCIAMSVEYRLAPETSFQGSVEDNYTALRSLYFNAESLGVDQARIAVMGESAGGGHAALLAIAARDRGEVPLCFQCLVYPMLDDRTGTSRQTPWHVGRIIWTAEENRFGWESFLGIKPGSRHVSAGVPARVANLAGLPPAWIGVGTLDLFVDEDIDFAQRLNHSGVPAQLVVVPQAYHGFDWAPAPISQWFNAAKADALRRAFKQAAAR